MDQHFDILLRGGRVIDPATGRDGVADVAITGGENRRGRARAFRPRTATEVIDVTGKLVIAGHDRHPRACLPARHRPLRPAAGHGRRALRRHHAGRSGRPELHDARRVSATSLPNPAATRVLCFISAYLVGGLEGHLYPELYGPGSSMCEPPSKAARENADLVRGIKAHAEIGGASRWGLEVIKLGKRDFAPCRASRSTSISASSGR